MKVDKKGFSLMEVLIALGVIGIVAALSIKIMFYNVQDKQYKSQLKKNYEVLQMVQRKIMMDYGGNMAKALTTACPGDDTNCLKNLFRDNLKYVDQCSAGNSYGKCHPDPVRFFSGSTANNSWRENGAGLILADGSVLMFRLDVSDCSWANFCGWIDVDVNGLNPPNQWGVDLFGFDVFSDGLYPFGHPGGSNLGDCNKSGGGLSCSYFYLQGN